MRAAMQPTEPSTDREPPTIAEVSAAFPQLEILSLIGQGGMGWVFKARQPKLNRIVALKLLPASLAERDAAFAGRFEREGQLLARLHHPNIVAVHDSGAAGGFFYLLMEFVEGVNLRQAMRSSRFTPAQALAIVPHICDALQFAHDEGVLHRDIKPENILLDGKGRVKLADFGIAKLVGAEGTEGTASFTSLESLESLESLTQTGTTLGTPNYMAPEQRDTPADVDNRADIYSLGVVFYELLTGELPSGSLPKPSAKSTADPRVDAIVQQALEKERCNRQESATEMKTQVEGVASTPPPENAEAMAATILERDYTLSIRSCLRRGWALVRGDFWPFVGITALVLAILSAAGGFSVSFSTQVSAMTRRSITDPDISFIGMVLSGPLMGGLYLYFLRKIRGATATVETVFAGFSQHFLNLFLGSFATAALTWLGFLCFVFPGIILFVLWIFTIPLIIDKRLEFWPAMQLSRKMVAKHFWKILALTICLCALCLAGLMALFVGIFIAAPIVIAALMYAYEDIFSAQGEAPAAPAPKPAAPPPDTPRDSSSHAMNPDNWYFYFIYFCPEDPRFVVPKRIAGFGWTLNFARPLAIPFVAAIIGVVLLILDLAQSAHPSRERFKLVQIAVVIGIAALCHRLSTRPTNSEQPTSGPVRARLSVTALLGAIWAGLGVSSWVNHASGYRNGFTPPMDSTLAVLTLLGATVLGWIAIVEIRKSAGQLRGVRLALFALLYIPIFLVAGLLATILKFIGSNHLDWHEIPRSVLKPQFTFVWSVLLLIAGVFMIRAVSRKLCLTPEVSANAQPPLGPAIQLQAVIFAVIGALAFFVVSKFGHIFADMGVALPHATRIVVETARVWGLMLFPLLLVVGASGCFFARELGGKRGLRQWSTAVVIAVVTVVVMATGALSISIYNVTELLGEPRSASANAEIERTLSVGPLEAEQTVVEIVKTFARRAGFVSCSLSANPKTITVRANADTMRAVVDFILKQIEPTLLRGQPMVSAPSIRGQYKVGDIVIGPGGTLITYRAESVAFIVSSRAKATEIIENGPITMVRFESGNLFQVQPEEHDVLRISLNKYDLSAGRTFELGSDGTVTQYPLFHTNADIAAMRKTIEAPTQLEK